MGEQGQQQCPLMQTPLTVPPSGPCQRGIMLTPFLTHSGVGHSPRPQWTPYKPVASVTSVISHRPLCSNLPSSTVVLPSIYFHLHVPSTADYLLDFVFLNTIQWHEQPSFLFLPPSPWLLPHPSCDKKRLRPVLSKVQGPSGLLSARDLFEAMETIR